MRMKLKFKKFKPKSRSNFRTEFVWIGLFVIIGITTLLITRAATPGISLIVDNTVLASVNVKAFGGDENIIVTWQRPENAPADLVGYYLTYKKKGSTVTLGDKQTIHESTQLQPLENGVEYDITVQSVRGS